MLHVDLTYLNQAFLDNLSDWCLGGPDMANGWTRTGPRLPMPNVKLGQRYRQMIDVNDGLAKNRREVERWHIDFLESTLPLESSKYYTEYLLPRMPATNAIDRANRFEKLFNNINSNGFSEQFPVMVADVSLVGIGIKYFRFDGCHRLASAFVLGMSMVPAYVFDVTILNT